MKKFFFAIPDIVLCLWLIRELRSIPSDGNAITEPRSPISGVGS